MDKSVFGKIRADALEGGVSAELEPGEETFYERGTLCHVPQDPRAHTQREWVSLTNSMVPRAGLNEDEEKLVLEWLSANAKDGGSGHVPWGRRAPGVAPYVTGGLRVA